MDTLFGKTVSELEEVVASQGLPKYTAGQIASWLYKKNITSWAEMSDLSLKNRTILSDRYELGLFPPREVQESVDGTKKYLYATSGSNFIESVYIPDKERATLCVSSQAGCKMNCAFCMTGKQGFQANLSAGEIVNQVRSLPERDHLTNLVYMGMGEPFDNIEAVLKSLEIFTSPWGFGYSPTRITVSTIGVMTGLKRFIEESRCHLAISLHSAVEKDRLSLMPMEKAWPLKGVIELIKRYDWRHQRRVSFEYILFQGVNDTPEHAGALVKLLNGIACRVNLISFHMIPGSPLQG
ncbi:MAG: 23S rRNA (adenine(2503)-C(2))-methyltransferase RlmN, partial [Bacteroidales bacterium]|nr:23S rRNA (adenine(2503)-C(2))-methyltransferase RlmN [Bacteroidales bacterium]